MLPEQALNILIQLKHNRDLKTTCVKMIETTKEETVIIHNTGDPRPVP